MYTGKCVDMCRVMCMDVYIDMIADLYSDSCMDRVHGGEWIDLCMWSRHMYPED